MFFITDLDSTQKSFLMKLKKYYLENDIFLTADVHDCFENNIKQIDVNYKDLDERINYKYLQ